jgi:hypothetical protein
MQRPTSTEGVDKFLVNLAKKANVSVAEIETDFFKVERPGSLLQRFATAEEVANLVLYYSSPLSSATNGAVSVSKVGLCNQFYNPPYLRSGHAKRSFIGFCFKPRKGVTESGKR